MSEGSGFHYEIEQSGDGKNGFETRIMCHGRIVGTTAGDVKDLVKPLIEHGGSITLDLGDVQYLDSSGLGMLVGLKASAVRQAHCRLLVENPSPRVRDLLHLTNLSGLFSL